jgi:hypothetical protein
MAAISLVACLFFFGALLRVFCATKRNANMLTLEATHVVTAMKKPPQSHQVDQNAKQKKNNTKLLAQYFGSWPSKKMQHVL